MRTQALGWLAAGVLAAGLNSSYNNGGQEWAHRIAERIEPSARAVLALASGQAEQFLAQARLMTVRRQATECPLGVLAQAQRIADQNVQFDALEAMSDRQDAELAQLEANRARIEARVARIRVAVAPVAMANLAPRVTICPRISLPAVRVPRMPMVQRLHVSAGPI